MPRTRSSIERDLARIIELATRHRPAIERDDPDLWLLLGSVIANAEDAQGVLEGDRLSATWRAGLEALASGNFTVNGRRPPRR